MTRRVVLAKAGGIGAMFALGGMTAPLRRIAGEAYAADRPLNLEMPIGLMDSWVTPAHLHYVRNHYDVPAINEAEWRLRVDGMVKRPLALDDLKRLPSAEEVVTLECAGNGRSFFDPKVPGAQWQRGATGTARYKGARLADVLQRAGISPAGRHVLLDGARFRPEHPDREGNGPRDPCSF